MLECKRCGHKWKQREKEKPIICPKCKTPYWDKATKIKKELVEKTKKSITDLHDLIIKKSGGLENIRNDGGLYLECYKLLHQRFLNKEDVLKVCALTFNNFARNHYFFDGNKRTAYCITKIFLFSKNFHLKTNYKESLPFVIKIADSKNKININEIQKWIKKSIEIISEKQDLEKYLKIIIYDLKYGEKNEE